MVNYASLRGILPAAIAILLLISAGTVQAAVCNPITSSVSCISQPCDQLGQTNLDSDRASIVQCLLAAPANITVNDCVAGGGCIWRGNPGAPLVRVSVELVGAGGGGGSGDWVSGGGGAGGQILQFDAMLHRGAVITLSVGNGGGGGMTAGGADNISADGGSGLYARGGMGGPGPSSGGGGGGGAGSVVMGDGLFAVAGGGGGGGGAAYNEPGLGGNQDSGFWLESTYPKIVPGFDGGMGLTGCNGGTAYNGTDGGGGGGGGGGYPAGAGGFWGCDDWQEGQTNPDTGAVAPPGYQASGGMNGRSYLYSANPTAGFSKGSNAAGSGNGGAGTDQLEASQGQCGRITIWSSTGAPAQFDCHNAPPVWLVQ